MAYESSKFLNDLDNMDRKLEIEQIYAAGPQIPRAKMPQVDREFTDDVLRHFAMKYKVWKEKVATNKLLPTQKDYNFGQVKQKVANGLAWNDSPFFVDKDYRLLDGHHRWTQGMFTQPDEQSTVYRLNMPYDRAIRILNALKYTYKVDDDGTKQYKKNNQNQPMPIDEMFEDAGFRAFIKECMEQPDKEVNDIVSDRLKQTTEDINNELEAWEKKNKEKVDESADSAKAKDFLKMVKDATLKGSKDGLHANPKSQNVDYIKALIDNGNISYDDKTNRYKYVTEGKIDSEEAFKEYAETILKKAHADNFDQKKADKIIADLSKKYDGDWGAAAGALSSGFGK